MAQHKPGSLKQKNKKHKGKDGKRAQNKVMGAGKVNATVRKSAKSNAQKDLNNKSERLNRNNQLKKIKRDQVWLQKRSGASGTSGTSATTKTIGVLALSDFADPYACVQECLRQMGVSSSIASGSPNVFHAFDSIDKTHFTFLLAPTTLKRDQFFALELTKAADIIMFVVCNDALNELSAVIDETGLSALSAMKAMGCPDALFCVQNSSLGEAMDEGLSSSSTNSKKKGAAAYASRKAVHQYIEEHALLPDARIVDLDLARSNNMLARTLRSMNPKPISWRAQRSYLVADAASVQVQEQPHSDVSTSAEPRCKVQLSGYLRGRPMSVHSLMHLVGVGAGRIVKVSKGRAPGATAGADDDLSPIFADKEKQDSLQLEAVGNGLMGEQTWPTEEELRMVGAEYEEQQQEGEGDRNAGRDRRALKADQLIPKGMSSYQADWFMDEEGQVDFNGKATAGAAAAAGAGGADEEEGDGSSIGDEEFTVGGGTISGKKSVAGSKFNSKGIPYTLKERQELDEAFPDEMDTPDDVSARVRFARYRALLSFRASPWHPKENLPQDYARIFQFEHFAGTQRRLLAESKAVEQMQMHHALQVRSAHKSGVSGSGSVCGSVISQGDRMDEEEEEEESEGEDSEGEDMETETPAAAPASVISGNRARRPSVAGSVGFNEAVDAGKITVAEADDFVQTGQYITIELEDVPALVAHRLQEYGFLLCYALYAHEHKLSVLHFSVQRHSGYTEPIKSKDEMLFVTGFRSFLTRPVYSESNLNCDKHKFERFLLSDRFSMASCYGPVLVSNCPLLVYKRTDPHADSSNSGNSRGCGEGWTLVATGTLANVEPDRIMLKKIILTGFPIRVRKKFAVVRHLFHDPQDVRWFKPAELVTKWGLRGHITEPVGTHGLLKAMFSGAIKQNDTVMLILYKRVYPKFPSFGLQIQ